MAQTVEELVIHGRMRDDISRPLRAVKQEAKETTAEIRRLARTEAATPVGRLDRGLGRLGDRLRGLDGRLSRVSERLGHMAGRVVNLTSKALVAGGAALTFFGLRSASSFQMSNIAFETLLGSAEKGRRLFAELQDINIKTPFELGEITGATQLLLRYGVAADRVVPVLKGLLDAAALSGDPAQNLNRLALALGQVAAKGTLQGTEARQLAESGINAYGIYAKALGITAREAEALGEKGKLGADLLLTSIADGTNGLENLRGGAEKLSRTVFGMFSNLKDAINVRLANAAQPLVDAFTVSMPQITELVGSAIDTIGPPLFGFVGDLSRTLLALLPVLGPILGTVATGVGRLLTAMLPAFSALEPVAVGLADSLVALVDELVPVMPDLVDAFVAMVAVLPEFVRLLADIVPLSLPILRLLTGLLELGPVRGAVAGLLGVLLGYRLLAGPAKIVAGMALALWKLATAQQAVNVAQAGGGIGGIGGGVGRGAGGFLGKLLPALGLGALTGAAAGGATKAALGDRPGADTFSRVVGTDVGLITAGARVGGLPGAIAGTGLAIGNTAFELFKAMKGGGSEPLATPSGTTVNDRRVTVAAGATQVYDPASDVDVTRAVAEGIAQYERDRYERGGGA